MKITKTLLSGSLWVANSNVTLQALVHNNVLVDPVRDHYSTFARRYH